MHPNAALVHRFYEAFNARDHAAMAACYHSDVVFSDPAFGELRGDEARAMWRMLCERATDLRVRATDVSANDATGMARWVADYSFGKAGRKVHNVIDARFRFRDGLIARHDDTFNVWRWSSMALGTTGRLLGWTPFLHFRIRRDARRQLDRYMASPSRARS